MPTKAEIEQELADLKERHEQFRKDVVEVAKSAKAENGWCESGFQEAMEALGLEGLGERVSGTMTLTLKFRGTPKSMHFDNGSVNDQWIAASLRYMDNEFTFDSDWEGGTIDVVNTVVDFKVNE